MKIFELTKSKGLIRKKKRIGRGNGSGKGNYSTKWHKGQKARSGFSMSPTFEWGQTSFVQRMPKSRGFKRHYKLVDIYSIVNLSSLEKDERITNDFEVTKFKLKELGYISKESNLVKVLWLGDFTKSLTFDWMDKFSKTAQEKIEKSGWKIK